MDIGGIATDHCVRATAADALQEGITVRLQRAEGTPGAAARGGAAVEGLAAAGATVC